MSRQLFSKFFNTMLLAFALIASTSCKEKEEPDRPQGGDKVEEIAISFSARVAEGDETVFFEEGAEVAVLIDGKTYKFSAGKDGLIKPETEMFWENKDEQVIKAWAPYSEVCPESFDSHKKDFLYAAAKLTPSDKNELLFQSQFAKIKVQFETEEIVENVTIGNEDFILNGNWEAGETQGQWSGATEAKKGELDLEKISNKEFFGYAIPQDVTAEKFVHATIDGLKLYFKLPNSMTLKAGFIYTFMLRPSEGIDPTPEPTLNANKLEIIADGNDKTTFSASPANTAKILGVGHDFTGTDGSTFATLVPGTYKFKAVNGKKESGVVTIKAIEIPKTPTENPLVLTPQFYEAKKYSSIPYTVKYQGMEVRDGFTFYVSEDGVNFDAMDRNEFSLWKNDKVFYGVVVYMGSTSNVVQVKCTSNPNPDAKPVDSGFPEISLSKTTVKANGKDMVTVSVFPAEATLICDQLPSFKGPFFKTTEAKDYTFSAVLNGKKTFKVKLTATPAAIEPEIKNVEIDGNKIKLIADGVDELVLVTTPSDARIIYTKDNGPEQTLTGKKFTTNTPGLYSFIARSNGKDSDPFIIRAYDPDDSGTPMDGDIIINGVGSGWVEDTHDDTITIK